MLHLEHPCWESPNGKHHRRTVTAAFPPTASPKGLSQRGSEGLGELPKGQDGHVVFAPLDQAHVGPVDAALECERLLRPPAFLSGLPQVLAQLEQYLVPVSHIVKMGLRTVNIDRI